MNDKFEAFGFERESISFMKSYLNYRKQRFCVNNNFNAREKVITVVTCTAYI